MKYLLFIILFVFPTSIKAQDAIKLIDSSFKYYYIDESWPKPFSPDPSLYFGIPDTASVIVEVRKIIKDSKNEKDIRSICIKKIVNKYLPKGSYQVLWDGKNSKGVKMNKKDKYYFYLYVLRKVKTLNGIGNVKFEANCKVTFP